MKWEYSLPSGIVVKEALARASAFAHSDPPGPVYMMLPRETLAQLIWQDVAQITGIGGTPPPWQIVRERRATFAAVPEEDGKRPPAKTLWNNLVLAGDWIAGSLPATIEGAIRSGNRAAELVGASKQ